MRDRSLGFRLQPIPGHDLNADRRNFIGQGIAFDAAG